MPTTAPEQGHVDRNAVYTLAAIKSRLNLGGAALRAARRNGLKVRRIGRAAFILGADLVDFIEREGK